MKKSYTWKRCKTAAERKQRDRERKRRWAAENYEANYERLKEWRANRKVQVRKKSTSR